MENKLFVVSKEELNSEVGITNLTEMVLATMRIGDMGFDVFKDGLSVFDGPKIWKCIKEIKKAFTHFKGARIELADLDQAEARILLALVKDEFVLDNKAAEMAIEKALKVIVDVADLLGLLKKKPIV